MSGDVLLKMGFVAGGAQMRSMWKALMLLLPVLLIFLTLPPAVHSQDVETVAIAAKPSVAVILAQRADGGIASGTAFMAAEKLILTAEHVVANAKRILVKFPDYPAVDARVSGADANNDVAVLAIPGLPVRPLPLGDVSQVREGQRVVVIGFPRIEALGAETATVTEGIVSAVRSGLIQMQAPVSPGNSGGPVLNLKGEVIGIVRGTLRGAQQGLNFAVPINTAKPLLGAAVLGTVPAIPPPTSQPVPASPTAVVIGYGGSVVIGYWLVVNGPDASLGVDSRRGIEIAMDDRGNQLMGYPLRLIGEDEGCNREGGIRAATSLAGNPEIIAAIGSSCSSAAVPGAPILWRSKIATVSPSNTAPRLTDPGRGPDYDGYLRVSHNDLVQGRMAAHFVFDILQVRRAATIHDGSPYAENLQAEFVRTFQQLGGTVTAQEVVSPYQTDMRSLLAGISSSRPELIYYPVFIAAGGFITRQARATPGLEGVRLMAADGMFSPHFFRAAGSAAQGMYFTSPDFSVQALGDRYREFLEKYQRKYGQPPLSAFYAHAYDAAMIIFAAIEKTAQRNAQGELVVDRVAVRDGLFATRNFQGVTGTITCNSFGDCGDPKIAVYQIISTDPATWNPGANPRKIYP